MLKPKKRPLGLAKRLSQQCSNFIEQNVSTFNEISFYRYFKEIKIFSLDIFDVLRNCCSHPNQFFDIRVNSFNVEESLDKYQVNYGARSPSALAFNGF